MRKFLKSVLVAAATLATLSAVAQDVIKVGAVLSTTGGAGYLGAPQEKALQMRVEEINKSGGVLGKQLKLFVYDDGSDAAKANGFAKRLIENDGVDVVLCGTTTGSSMAMIPIVEKAKVPFISCAGGVVVVEPVKPYVFKTASTDRMQIARVYADMNKRGIKRIALISETTGYGQSGRKESQSAALKYGIEIVADESYGAKDTDMTAQLAKIRAIPNLQAIFVFGAGQGAVVLAKNMAQLGIKTPHYESASVATSEYITLSGTAAEGVRVSGTALLIPNKLPDSDPQKKVLMAFAKTYEAKYKEEASPFGGYAFDALDLYVNAVSRAKSTDKEKVRDALERTSDYVGVSGIFTMSPTDHMGLDPKSALKLMDIKKGEWSLVD
ncbi:MAG: ABC transporter substrate-binding protein [Rhodoferax sp.]|nr:ABC transporter substrate-binding protein [Rhodoferax sp.]